MTTTIVPLGHLLAIRNISLDAKLGETDFEVYKAARHAAFTGIDPEKSTVGEFMKVVDDVQSTLQAAFPSAGPDWAYHWRGCAKAIGLPETATTDDFKAELQSMLATARERGHSDLEAQTAHGQAQTRRIAELEAEAGKLQSKIDGHNLTDAIRAAEQGGGVVTPHQKAALRSSLLAHGAEATATMLESILLGNAANGPLQRALRGDEVHEPRHGGESVAELAAQAAATVFRGARGDQTTNDTLAGLSYVEKANFAKRYGQAAYERARGKRQ